MKKYTFSKYEIEDEIERLSALKKLTKDKNRESEVAARVVLDDDEKGPDDDNYFISYQDGISGSPYFRKITKSNTYKTELSLISKQRIIRDIRESSATPFNKLTELIATTANDYNSNPSKTLMIFAKLSKIIRDNNAASVIVDTMLIIAETEIKMGVTWTVQQWYDTVMSLAEKMQPVSDEKLQLKAENLSLKNKVQDLDEQLKVVKNLENKRIEEIDKWHGMYEHAETEVSMWQQKYEEAKDEASKRADCNKYEVDKLKQENARLKKSIGFLRNKRDFANELGESESLCMRDNTITREIILHKFVDDETYKKKEKALEDKIKNLQEKLGNESVPLSVLAEGLKDYVEEAGIREAHELFNHLNNLLIDVPAWTKNVPELRKFFRKARKEMDVRNVTMTGEHATYNENNNK